MSVAGKNCSQVPPPCGDWSYVSGDFSSSNVSAKQRPMRLLLRRDGIFSGRFVFVRVIRRFSLFLSKATDMLRKRRWGAMRRSSLASAEGDFGLVDQPVTEYGGPECIDVATTAEGDLGVRAAVGRSPFGSGFWRLKLRPRFCSRDAKKASPPSGWPLWSWSRRTSKSSSRITLISRRRQLGASWSKGATRTSDEATGPNLHLLGTTELGDELSVALVVLCTKEGSLAAVTPLGDVMRNAGSNDTCQAIYFRKLPRARTRRKNQV